MAAKHVDRLVTSDRATQPQDRFEYREIGLGCTVMLDALASRDRHTRGTRDELEGRLDQRCLPDPRFARNEHELSRTLASTSQGMAQLPDFLSPPDERSPRRKRGRPLRSSLCRSRVEEPDPGARIRNSTDEAPATPRQGLDEHRLRANVPKCHTKLTKGVAESIGADRHAGPDRLEQLIAALNLPRVLDQVPEQGEYLRGQRDFVVPPA